MSITYEIKDQHLKSSHLQKQSLNSVFSFRLLIEWFDLALQRYQQRKQLVKLDDRLLKDIGISREQVSHEVNKPFWK